MTVRSNMTATVIVMLGALLFGSGCGNIASHKNVDRGLAYIESHEYEEAAQCFDAAEKAGENARVLYRAKGLLDKILGEYDSAAENFLKSLAATSGIPGDMDFDTNYYLADTYIKQEKYDEAIKVYDAILALRKKDKDAYYMRGMARLYMSDHDGATADFNKAMTLSPRNYDLRIMIYKALSANGFEEEGREILEACLNNTDPNMTNYEKGQISYYLGNNADAQSYLELARNERDAQKAPVVLLLGQTGEKQGDYNYAISVYKTFLAEDPDHPDIYNQLGLCQTYVGDYDSAVNSFEAGLALGNNEYSRALLMNEITAYEYAGNYAQAKTLMEKYRKAYPDDKDAEREEIFLSSR
ncbi:Tfp pilus assembly protein PilF [Butyrivibrio sp. ob235]|uniref:tetratricopeptide repeat protein n=1 Tax=Butyrivibrio sp. ob235 TaxID=1761780 RepID=UPI0008CB0441|nr:tetratricopeptide repeat protein [Butyrivibrio sp. ob235]SEK70261.1 Tfp pilus assembly protein PilF [Butyrivibrio sp. ob235]